MRPGTKPPGTMLRSLVSSSAKAPEEAEPFEVQAFFVRTKGAGNVESWPDVLTVRATAAAILARWIGEVKRGS